MPNGNKKGNIELKVGSTVAPCQAAWACHLRKEEKANQRSGTVSPCHVAEPCYFSPVVLSCFGVV